MSKILRLAISFLISALIVGSCILYFVWFEPVEEYTEQWVCDEEVKYNTSLECDDILVIEYECCFSSIYKFEKKETFLGIDLGYTNLEEFGRDTGCINTYDIYECYNYTFDEKFSDEKIFGSHSSSMRSYEKCLNDSLSEYEINNIIRLSDESKNCEWLDCCCKNDYYEFLIDDEKHLLCNMDDVREWIEIRGINGSDCVCGSELKYKIYENECIINETVDLIYLKDDTNV